MSPLFAFEPMQLFSYVLYGLGVMMALAVFPLLAGMRYIPHNSVGIIEKLWSPTGSLTEGRMIVVDDEAGYHAAVLRGGVYFCFWFWQYRIHKISLTTVSQGKIGYVFSRDGRLLKPEQTIDRWHHELLESGGFDPVLVGSLHPAMVEAERNEEQEDEEQVPKEQTLRDNIAIVTIHDGPPSTQGLLGTLIELLVAEKAGFQTNPADGPLDEKEPATENEHR